LLGVFVGLIGFLMDFVEMMLVWVKDNNTQKLIEKDNVVVSWLFYTFFSVLLVLLATIMTIYWGTGSPGSGVAEVIGYINGVNYPLTIDFRTFLTKIVGVVFAVAGGLAVGKEGPLAHIGANVGAAIVSLPSFEFCQNDYKKR
jgi:chloride channel 7